MTVKTLIELLSNIDNKELRLVIDCPHCGKANELRSIKEVVVLGSRDAIKGCYL